MGSHLSYSGCLILNDYRVEVERRRNCALSRIFYNAYNEIPYRKEDHMNISKRRVVKFVVRFIVGGAAGTTITRIIQQNVEPNEDKRFDSARLAIGTGILSWMIQDYVGQYTDKLIDDAVDNIAEVREELKSIQLG